MIFKRNRRFSDFVALQLYIFLIAIILVSSVSEPCRAGFVDSGQSLDSKTTYASELADLDGAMTNSGKFFGAGNANPVFGADADGKREHRNERCMNNYVAARGVVQEVCYAAE